MEGTFKTLSDSLPGSTVLRSSRKLRGAELF